MAATHSVNWGQKETQFPLLNSLEYNRFRGMAGGIVYEKYYMIHHLIGSFLSQEIFLPWDPYFVPKLFRNVSIFV